MNKILIVDDEEAILMLYHEELSNEGYEVVCTGDCKSLLDLIAEQRPDLVVLDIMMGEVNGLDILQEIRNLYYNLPVILCSAYPIYKYDMRFIAADYYVVKSFDLSELKLKVKMALEGRMPFPSGKLIRDGSSSGRLSRSICPPIQMTHNER